MTPRGTYRGTYRGTPRVIRSTDEFNRIQGGEELVPVDRYSGIITVEGAGDTVEGGIGVSPTGTGG